MRKPISGRLYGLSAFPGVFQRNTIINLQPYAHISNSPLSNEITQPNLTMTFRTSRLLLWP